jgi:hypothetical protein
MNDFEKFICEQLETELQKKLFELLAKYPNDYEKTLDLIIEYIEQKK